LATGVSKLEGRFSEQGDGKSAAEQLGVPGEARAAARVSPAGSAANQDFVVV
jgi:hypothetical protein